MVVILVMMGGTNVFKFALFVNIMYNQKHKILILTIYYIYQQYIQ